MPQSDSPSLTLEREVAAEMDHIKNVVRLSKADMDALSVFPGDLIEVAEETRGARAFARCYYMYPSEEGKFHHKIQLDWIVRANLGADHGQVVKVRRVNPPYRYAEKMTVKPTGPPSPENPDIHPRWLLGLLEGLPLWEGCALVVPVKEKQTPLKVISLEPKTQGPLIITLLTSLSVLLEERPPIFVHLHGMNLDINFERDVTDYDSFSQLLVKRGFEQEREVSHPRGMAHPPFGMRPMGPTYSNVLVPSSRQPPHLKKGHWLVSLFPSGYQSGKTVTFSFLGTETTLQYEEGKRQTYLNEMEEVLNLVKKIFQEDLNVSPKTDIKSCFVRCHLSVWASVDAIKALQEFENLGSLIEDMTGYRSDNNNIKLYQKRSDKMLIPGGLLEINLNTGDVYSYHFDALYSVPDLDSIVPAVQDIEEKVLKIAQTIEGRKERAAEQ